MSAATTIAPALPASGNRRRRRGRWNAPLVAGLILFGLIVACALCAPLLTSQDPLKQDLANAFLAPGAKGHLLGTDELGRDVLARLLYGARVDLRVGVLAVISPLILGSLIGLIAGWFGGWIDAVIGRIVDIVIAFPFLVLVIALVFAMGPGTTSIYTAITLVGWVAYCRIVRGQVLVAKEQEYAMAARASGLPTWRILLRHLLPNVVLQAVVFSMSDIVLTLLAIVTLGFLGLGVPPPTPDWGTMIQEGQQFILDKWYMSTIPGLAIIITGLALALIADGIVEKANQ
ncbi:ABC transporter permease [Planotetraspora kaengkrachanensis]|uniref:Peptide ABC transporter permease n=1 Tax=Planotetraspora kaengkrachanensis TaxID=575193 RepID=A0A8J3PXM8_9ACTN|nr:ABC transporter permease [Planotetraspora kaengkrachanensis]GIG83041.1 peptide ABC transporter permease [Planotetraspora kaengkrachanensis]